MSETESERIVLVRATVNLTRFPVGKVQAVNPDHPVVAALLAAKFLVPVED